MIEALSFAVEDSKVRPGWIAFFIVLGLCVATVILWRSMNKQLSKITVKRAAELDDSDEVEDSAGEVPPADER
jgi:hypothetical protein